MSAEKRFSPLRALLRALGLSAEAVDDVVNWIEDLLAGERKETETEQKPILPYKMRDHFLTPAELHFLESLRLAVNGQAALCTKVGLGDLFAVKDDDASRFRIYTNKIDRKHVDFVLCDTATMRPLIAIELDDKSHQRPDRRERDAFVDEVFKAAGLPLLHVPVKRTYVVEQLAAQIAPYVRTTPEKDPAANTAPRCPKCGGEMVLRTAKSGANAGGQFWGCANFPTCRSMLPYQHA